MGYITRRDVYLILFREWLRAKGYSEKYTKTNVDTVKVISNFAGKQENITRKDVERLIEERRAGKWYRASLRKAFRNYNEWRQWWENEGIKEFEEWLRRQGYSEATVRDYLIMLRMPGGRRKDTERERKRLRYAIRAYQRFLLCRP